MSHKTIKLDEDQRRKAEKLLDMLDNGEIEYSDDILEDWTYFPEHYDYDLVELADDYVKEEGLNRKKSLISVSKIAGTTHSRTPIKEHRLRKVVNWLLNGQYEVKHERPPKLEKLEDEYYVSVDGHHRVLAFKAVGLEEIFVEYVDVELKA